MGLYLIPTCKRLLICLKNWERTPQTLIASTSCSTEFLAWNVINYCCLFSCTRGLVALYLGVLIYHVVCQTVTSFCWSKSRHQNEFKPGKGLGQREKSTEGSQISQYEMHWSVIWMLTYKFNAAFGSLCLKFCKSVKQKRASRVAL